MRGERASAGPLEEIAAHPGGPALVLGGSGCGRSESIARRFVHLAEGELPAAQIAVLTYGPAARVALRARIEALLRGPYEELWIETWEGFAERLLRDYALEAGIDPFFEVVGPADRLAILIERLDDLPLRRHEIRGNAAGLLARLLERIDVLKAEGVGPADIRDLARAAERGAGGRAERESALRELEFADLFERHDALLRERDAIDEPELVLELGRLLSRRADVSAAIGDRFPQLMIDELEDAGASSCGLIPLLAPHGNALAVADPDQGLAAFRAFGEAAPARFLATYPDAERFELREPLRGAAGPSRVCAAISGLLPEGYGERPRTAAPERPEAITDPDSVRLWRCANERAQAQAVAREVERLLAAVPCRLFFGLFLVF